MNKSDIVSLIEDFEAEINNGGFDQLFFNSLGDKTEQIVEALNLIKANHTAQIVVSAKSKFPNSIAPEDQILRQDQLLQISPDGDAFENEDDLFYEYTDDLAGLLKSYIKYT